MNSQAIFQWGPKINVTIITIGCKFLTSELKTGMKTFGNKFLERRQALLNRSFFNKFNRGTYDFVTAGMQLKYISEYKPDSTAIIYIDKEERTSSITWSQLHVQSNRLAWMRIFDTLSH